MKGRVEGIVCECVSGSHRSDDDDDDDDDFL